MAQRIVRHYLAAAARGAAGALERFIEIEGAVVVGKFFSGGDVAHGDFEIQSGAEACRRAGMIDEAPVVPTENTIPAPVEIGIAESRP
ncbi:MAG: hypothetical protein ABSG41_16525 [Bryobacteraceae bacterium]